MSRRIAAALLACAALISSCASITVNSLPQPGNAYRDGYDIVLEFANVLNLPDRAKVVLDGTDVGVVTGINIADGHANVTSRIASGVEVPSNVHATLQQATVLGDIYVALEPDANVSAPPLMPGGRVPLVQTTSPPQLEDTIANLANFVASGSIQRAQNSVIRINNLNPPEAEIRELASRVAVDLSDLSTNLDVVDKWLEGVAGTGDVMYAKLPKFQHWFSPAGMLGFDRGTEVASYVGILLPSIGSIYSGGYWLVPLLESLGTTMEAIQHSKWAVEDEIPRWRKLWTDLFLPVDKYPAINITSIVGPDGREMSGNVEDVLRMLGAMP
ncbi:MlaD family protein [Mycolicibacterium moriokaense]|uniref:Mce family protein n=1 Tax=Mycolicibacterium moriokaense TaxID=39691 RepID=A0AAD1HH15_9MYCO|nr:MlaD family protein [Mycolicibacterium moriokaense]MCV7039427.1 MCE family protein [Mycolicibacterium moriokaense]BBX03953.1 putative Mce family protein [Mycolicibacterium moriokaense]